MKNNPLHENLGQAVQSALAAREKSRRGEASIQRDVDSQMATMNKNIDDRVARISGMRGIPQSQFDSKPSESGVRSDSDFDPTAPGSQDAIRRAQVKDNLSKGRTTSLSSMDPGHPEYYGQTVALSGGARAKLTGPRRNPGRDRAIQDILNQTQSQAPIMGPFGAMGPSVGQARKAQLDAMSGEELSKEVTAQAQKNFKSDLGKIEAENRAKEMKKYGFSDEAMYDAARSGYSDAMGKVDKEYRYGGAKDKFDAGIASMQGQRQDIGYGKGSDRAGRHAINRQIAAKRQEDRIARRNARRDAVGGMSRDEYMKSRAVGPPGPSESVSNFPTSPSDFVKMLHEQR